MKLKFRIFISLIVLLLITSISISIVLAVSGGTPEPGSDQDPLISKSYIDSIIQTYNTKLQQLQGKYEDAEKKLNEVSEKVNLQDKTIKELQSQLSALKSNGSSTSQNTGKGDTKPQNTQTGNSSSKAAKKGTVNASALNIRTEASATSKLAGKAAKGETVEILSESKGWYRIKTSKGVTGWVMAKYITIKK